MSSTEKMTILPMTPEREEQNFGLHTTNGGLEEKANALETHVTKVSPQVRVVDIEEIPGKGLGQAPDSHENDQKVLPLNIFCSKY